MPIIIRSTKAPNIRTSVTYHSNETYLLD